MYGKLTHVVVGVIENSKGEILIAKRPEHLHQGGLWEYPGGKVERDESPFQALQRELREEVALEIKEAKPLIRIPYHYPDKSVLLDVMQISEYEGLATGLEGQAICWVSKSDLSSYAFPAANRAITQAIQLPERYLISGDFNDTDDFLAKLKRALAQGIRLIQLRTKQLSEKEQHQLSQLARQYCERYQARLLVNTTPEKFTGFDADGIHLASKELMACSARPLAEDKLVAASVHNRPELEQAMRIGVDFIVLSPVLPTASHPDADSLGWASFTELVEQATIPVYALGGLTQGHLQQAQANGAQGIAAIRALWEQ